MEKLQGAVSQNATLPRLGLLLEAGECEEALLLEAGGCEGAPLPGSWRAPDTGPPSPSLPPHHSPLSPSTPLPLSPSTPPPLSPSTPLPFSPSTPPPLSPSTPPPLSPSTPLPFSPSTLPPLSPSTWPPRRTTGCAAPGPSEPGLSESKPAPAWTGEGEGQIPCTACGSHACTICGITWVGIIVGLGSIMFQLLQAYYITGTLYTGQFLICLVLQHRDLDSTLTANEHAR